MKRQIKHIKVDLNFWKKLKNEATNKGYSTMTKYTEVLGKSDQDICSIFGRKRNEKKHDFGF